MKRLADLKQILSLATGHWPNILKSIGIPDKFLTNKHGPCPLCGGKDRFRFDNKGDRGTYFCGQCGAGDGFQLLQKFTGWPTKKACDCLNNFMQIAPSPKPIKTFTLRIAEQAINTGEAELKERAKALEAEVQRHQQQAFNVPTDHPYLVKKEIHLENVKAVGDYLIIPMYTGNFQLVSYQRIWPDGTKKFLKGTKKDGVYGIVGRYQAGKPIIISESFSTSFAIYESLGIACWISFGHSGFQGALRSILSHFEHGGRVIIACDNDDDQASLNSALKAFDALKDHHIKNTHIAIPVAIPELSGTDFCDLYLSEGTEAVRAVFKELLP